MVGTYAHATSYTDRGDATTIFSGPISHVVHRPFETAFIRAVGFRFDASDGYDPRSIVTWLDNGTIHRGRTGGAIGDVSKLGSSSFTSAVPRLLVPGLVHGPSVVERSLLRLDGAEAIDGHSCWRLLRTRPDDDDLTLWIDQASHLLRRTASHHHFEAAIDSEAFDANEVTTYEPVVDAPIDASRLQGLPPTATRPEPDPTDPWIGVGMDGRHITHVFPRSPAAAAGLRVTDEIVSLDGSPIADASGLHAHVQLKAINDRVTLVVHRAGQDVSIPVVVGDRAEIAGRQAALFDKPAPQFVASTAGGPYPADLAALAGHVVVLYFASPSRVICAGCPAPSSFMDTLQAKYGGQGLRVVELATESPTELATFSAAHQLHYTLAHDDGAIAETYFVVQPSLVVLIDQRGVVRLILQDTTGLEMLVQYYLAHP